MHHAHEHFAQYFPSLWVVVVVFLGSAHCNHHLLPPQHLPRTLCGNEGNDGDGDGDAGESGQKRKETQKSHEQKRKAKQQSHECLRHWWLV